MAIEDGGLDLGAIDKTRLGVVVGSAFGGMDTFEKQTLNLDNGKKVSPFTIPQLLGNTASGMIAIELGCQGVYRPVLKPRTIARQPPSRLPHYARSQLWCCLCLRCGLARYGHGTPSPAER